MRSTTWPTRARTKRLMPDDVLGGTFTITNPGPFGTYMTMAIINQPQVAILSTDGIKKRPVVLTGPDGGDSIAIHHTGMLVLTWDHRAFDGAYAAAFLRRDADRARAARLGSRARLMLRARWLGRVPYGEADQLQRALHARADRRLPAAARTPARVHARHHGRSGARAGAAGARRRRPRARRTAAATSPTTGPGSSSGTRSSRCPTGATACATSWRTCGRSKACSSTRSPSFGVAAHREPRYPGVWVGDEKIAAVGVKVARGRTRHGFALNVDPDLAMFEHIVPCGIRDRGVTSLAARARRPRPTCAPVVDAVVTQFAAHFARRRRGTPGRRVARAPRRPRARSRREAGEAVAGDSPVRLLGRLAEAGVSRSVESPAPAVRSGCGCRPTSAPDFRATKRLMQRARPAHRVRGGRVPEHLRVLGRPHRDVHDPRRPLHPRLRLLPGRHPEAAPARSRRARTRRRRDRARSGSSTR